MQNGLRQILELHTPVELSSLCGCLHLKVQEKASTSIDQIIRYASEGEELNPERIQNILRFMWETPLWEYLHSTGHPVISMRPDPKATIMELWENGGFLDGSKGFNPHFVVREVKKRYEEVKSEDITSRLEKLRIVQEAVKKAETKILADHDYTNILTYFKKMYELRSLETATRDHLIGELEAARGRLDSGVTLVNIVREQLEEAERFSISVAESLNKKLATAESIADSLFADKCQMEADLQGVLSVLNSYLQCEMDRTAVGGGALPPKTFQLSRTSSGTVRVLLDSLKQYKDLRDEDDSLLRERSQYQLREAEKYQAEINELRKKLEDMTNESASERAKKEEALAAVSSLARTVSRLKVKHEASAQQSWNSSLR